MRDWWKMLDGLGRHQSNGERSEKETSRHLIILLFCWRRILLFVVAVVTWNERVSHRTEASRQKRSAWPTADNHHKCVNEREKEREEENWTTQSHTDRVNFCKWFFLCTSSVVNGIVENQLIVCAQTVQTVVIVVVCSMAKLVYDLLILAGVCVVSINTGMCSVLCYIIIYARCFVHRQRHQHHHLWCSDNGN